ncbi:uncharacterized protein [Ptychodera flava]|uniref:uncharacterized protein isoform X2 n=1 Tax=Ptychodera flava TaxID=63121 RepID=UPI003969C07D
MRTTLLATTVVLSFVVLFSKADSNYACEDGTLLGKHDKCMGGSRFMKWKCECEWPYECDYSPAHKSYVCMGAEDYDSDLREALKRFVL